jgi:hypothetical protein
MRRSVVLATVVSCGLALGSALAASPAAADETVVVAGLSFPPGDTYVTTFGCADLYHGADAAPLVRLGNLDSSPAGRRSAGVLPLTDGSATGPVTRVDSVAATSVEGFTARADRGGAGVAWVWYVAPGLDLGQVWVGRAPLNATPGWGYVDAAGAAYDWQKVDALTGRVVEAAGTATTAAFTRAHGDGPGYLLAGLGCDGTPFSFDALQVGSPGAVTTYDVEGLVLGTTISASGDRVPPGGSVTLTGATLDSAGVPAGTALVLEARAAGESAWQAVGDPVEADRDGYVRTTVEPTVRTQYRWSAPDTGYADASLSGVVTVRPH